MNLSELEPTIDHDAVCQAFHREFSESYGEVDLHSITEKDIENDTVFVQGLQELKVRKTIKLTDKRSVII
jgi:lipoate-protein ligase A